MAKSSFKVSDLLEFVWSVLLFACIGLALAHIVSVTRTQSVSGESIIERTFTTDRNLEAQ